MRRLPAILMIAAFCASGCGEAGREPGTRIEGARITLPAVQGRPGAAYFTITAAGSGTSLAGITSPRVQRIELHESMAAGMGPLRDARLPAGQAASFEPGGRHAMLFGIDPALRAGDRMPLTFALDGAPPLTVEAVVQGPGGGDAH